MADIPKVKILVLGDSGVGKTSLVHLICHNAPIPKPSWTIGCGCEVKLHDYKAGTPAEKTYFVELWDIGGWAAHKNSRGIFYNPVHGLILCHDLTNRKSHQNLKKWLTEILNKDGKGVKDDYDYDPEQFAGSSLPMLVIGTKLDLAQSVRDSNTSRSSYNIAEECGADEVSLDCTHTRHLAPGSSNAVKISRFFDKVIERKHHSRPEPSQNYLQSDRRRAPSSHQMYGRYAHVDLRKED